MGKYECPRSFLIDFYEEKKRRNPRYSLRAWAKAMDVSVSTISRVISGERKLTYDLAIKLIERLELSQTEKTVLMLLTLRDKARSEFETDFFTSLVSQTLSESERKDLL